MIKIDKNIDQILFIGMPRFASIIFKMILI